MTHQSDDVPRTLVGDFPQPPIKRVHEVLVAGVEVIQLPGDVLGTRERALGGVERTAGVQRRVHLQQPVAVPLQPRSINLRVRVRC